MARMFAPLPRSFYTRPTLRVARELLGCFLVRRAGRKTLVGRIVEVEAYLGSRDPASHAYRGQTRRNEVMFRGGGHLYVYFTYGMHFCANVVTGREGSGHAVLIRALEPVAGLETMRRRRRPSGTNEQNLTSGPARLCQALAIGREENGTDLCGRQLFLSGPGPGAAAVRVGVTTRIGISRGTAHRWRFFVRDSPYVSPGRPSNSRAPATVSAPAEETPPSPIRVTRSHPPASLP